MFRSLFYPAGLTVTGSFGLLVLRIAVGVAFLFHGWPKIQNPMGWMGEQADVPDYAQAAAAVAEFVGGACLIVGLFTRFFSLLLAGTMAVAAGMVHIPAGHPYVALPPETHSWELAGVYFACSILFLLVGPGFFSADALMFRPRSHDL